MSASVYARIALAAAVTLATFAAAAGVAAQTDKHRPAKVNAKARVSRPASLSPILASDSIGPTGPAGPAGPAVSDGLLEPTGPVGPSSGLFSQSGMSGPTGATSPPSPNAFGALAAPEPTGATGPTDAAGRSGPPDGSPTGTVAPGSR